jgi:hypothetical protein
MERKTLAGRSRDRLADIFASRETLSSPIGHRAATIWPHRGFRLPSEGMIRIRKRQAQKVGNGFFEKIMFKQKR